MTNTTMEMIAVEPIKTDSAKEYNDRAMTIQSQVKNLVIKDQASYENAASLLKAIKDIGKMAEEARKKITVPLDQAKKAVMELFQPTATATANLEAHLKSLMIAYTNEQNRIREAQEAKLRQQAETEERRKKKELEERAAKAEASGKVEKAEELRQQAQEVRVEAPVLAPTVQKVSGVSMMKLWKARCVDINKVPREYMVINQSMIDGVAKATKGSLVIAGIEFFAEDVLASR